MVITPTQRVSFEKLNSSGLLRPNKENARNAFFNHAGT
jgi:hypothetical protein